MMDWLDGYWETIGRWAMLGVVVGIPTCTYRSCFSDEALNERQVKRAAEQAQEALDAVPRVIREIDGCKVYAFKSQGMWHYFTRCPASTTTNRTYEQCHKSGKTTVCENKTEQIVTENK